MPIRQVLEKEFSLAGSVVDSIVSLLDSKNTVPFIARYRKEQTGSLDDQALRQFARRLDQLRTLEARREEVSRLIDEQGKLSREIKNALAAAASMTQLDDIYRPFRPQRRTRATMAIALGLEPLADLLLQVPDRAALTSLIRQLLEKEPQIGDSDAALAGALDILAARLSDDSWLRQRLRRLLNDQGVLRSVAKVQQPTVYETYYDYTEPVRQLAPHRVLAINRGEKEDILTVTVDLDPDQAHAVISQRLGKAAASPWLDKLVPDAWKRLILPSLASEIRRDLTQKAQDQAISVFAANLRSLLLQPPVRNCRILALDPGFRTGCKMAAVDETGRILATGVICPVQPLRQTKKAGREVLDLIRQHRIQLIAIGNGTASRETELFVRDLVLENELDVKWLVVSEAGASVYSASEAAALELPDLDVSLRGAVSIARRVQDPLAELVKIEPRSLGVGQYQHDLNRKELDVALAAVVEDCVNQIGVDLNTASAALLTHVAGLGGSLAANIVSWREENGPFTTRQQLLKVPKLGPATFRQCAGFLRLPGAANLLDNTSVHPESYAVVARLSQILDCPPTEELARQAAQQDLAGLADQIGAGLPTLKDIIEALARPGRDPRDDLPPPVFSDDVLELADLKPGMIMQGTVRNVADFGAFVDVGVHQDGLVHISQLANRYVEHPLAVVQPGQLVKVKVLGVDLEKKRLSLSMKDVE